MTASTLSSLSRIGALTLLAWRYALPQSPAAEPSPRSSTSTPSAGQSITGQVHGGQQTVTGAHIYLFAAGTSGYGGPSVSLLNPTSPGVTTDANGSYVITDSNGNFSLTEPTTAPPANRPTSSPVAATQACRRHQQLRHRPDLSPRNLPKPPAPSRPQSPS